MRDSGRTIQVQQLVGRDYIVTMGPGYPRVDPPLYGALMLADDSDEPVAVVVHTKKVLDVPGLTIAAITDGPGGTKEVTYMAANTFDPRPSLGPGQGA